MNTWTRRWLTIGGCFLLLIATIAPTARAAPLQQATPQIEIANNPTYGTILVSSTGETLYILTAETNTVIKCADKCLTFWPPLTVPSASAAPSAAPGVSGQLGTVARPGSNPQITYDGYPVYMYYQDKAPGDTNGQGTQFAGGAYTVIPAKPVAITSATQLAVPFPNGWQTDGVGNVTPDQADGNILALAHVHSVLSSNGYHFSYKESGMLFGYVEQGHQKLGDGTRFQWEYVGSVYPTAVVAQNAFNALSSFYPKIKRYYPTATTNTCTFPGAEQCYQALAPVLQDLSGHPQNVVIRILQESNSVFEAAYILSESDYVANTTQGDQLLDTLSNDYVRLFPQSVTPTPIPSPTTTQTSGVSFSITRLWWEKLSTKGHADDPATTTAQPGESAYFAVAFHVSSAPPSLPVSVTFRITWSGHIYLNNGTLTATDPTGTYHSRVKVRLPGKPGAYSGTVTVEMGGKLRQRAATIAVLPIQTPSFSFDALQSLNANYQPKTLFRPGEKGYVKVLWTVRNLSRSVTYTIKRKYYVPSSKPADHGWMLLSDLDDSGTANNGAGFRTFVFFAPPATTSAYKIVVSIHMLSRWSRPRVVIVRSR